MVSYMVKSANDQRLWGQRFYNCSRGLGKPVEMKLLTRDVNFGSEEDYLEKIYKLDKIKPTFENAYFGEYTGKVVYKEYNLKRLGLIKNSID